MALNNYRGRNTAQNFTYVYFLVVQNKAENLVQDLFLQDTFERGKTNSSLDQAVATLSRELIDDFPASDPRWAESLPQGECVNPSLLWAAKRAQGI